jgi:hypothetical protein
MLVTRSSVANRNSFRWKHRVFEDVSFIGLLAFEDGLGPVRVPSECMPVGIYRDIPINSTPWKPAAISVLSSNEFVAWGDTVALQNPCGHSDVMRELILKL